MADTIWPPLPGQDHGQHYIASTIWPALYGQDHGQHYMAGTAWPALYGQHHMANAVWDRRSVTDRRLRAFDRPPTALRTAAARSDEKVAAPSVREVATKNQRPIERRQHGPRPACSTPCSTVDGPTACSMACGLHVTAADGRMYHYN